MPVQLVAYDLRRPGQNYSRVIAAIEAIGEYRHPQESVWLVKTSLTSRQLFDVLAAYVDTNDALMVTEVSAMKWAISGVDRKSTDWLTTNAR